MYSILLPGMISYFIEMYVFSFVVFFDKKKRSFFPLRVFVGLVLGVPLAFVPSKLMLGDVNIMFLLVCIYVGLIFVATFSLKPLNYFFNMITAMAAQHLTWNIFCLSYEMIKGLILVDFAFVLWMYILIYIVSVAITVIIRHFFFGNYEFEKVDTISLVSGFCFMIVCHVISNTIHAWSFHLRLYTIISAIFILMIQSGVFNYRKKELEAIKLEMENAQLELLISHQAKNQETIKQNLELINGKYHDIKKQLAVIKESNDAIKAECISDIEKNIAEYDNIARTGNEMLDVVLTQKSMFCASAHIKFTYIVDGSSVSFMNKNDLSALFLNMLDNAIESVIKEEEGNRIIKLNVVKKKGFLIIKQENYCSASIEFKNGLPVSKKENKEEHGYGAKSISFIASKYSGNVTFDYTENIFSVNILIPSMP